MATYSPQQLGITAPSGGFQQGGWYSGRQYWGGTLGEPGVIHPQSNQQGAGQAVSAEVNRQTSVAAGKAPSANQDYINAGAPITNQPTATPSSAQAILDNYHTQASNVATSISSETPQSDAEILAKIESEVQPSTPPPATPNLSATYQNLAITTGLTGLQSQQTSLMQQSAAVQSSLEAQQAQEESTGGKVPLNVIAGRQTEEQRQAQIKLDSINLQLGVVNQAITNAQNGISMVMQFTQQDYQNASQAYEQEFNNNMAIVQAVSTEVKNQQDFRVQLQQTAAANLNTIVNLISSGNLNMNQLSPTQQTQINSLELQAGLPIGTISQIQLSPKDRLLNVTQYRGQVQALTMGSDGKLNIQTFGNIDNTTPTQQAKVEYTSAANQDAQSGVTLQDLLGIYQGYLTPNEIYNIYNQVGYYGAPKESAAQLRAWGITQIPYSATQ